MARSQVFGLRSSARSGKTDAVQGSAENETASRFARSLLGFSALTLALGALGASACGPSVQSIYEGNVRFEHCYRLDLEPDVAPTHREACWKEWLGMYTYGQPRDRIEYARRRVRAFADGDPNCPKLDIADARAPETRQFYLVVPAPTSVHAPPPPIATRWYGDAGSPPPAPTPTLTAPQDGCGSACRDNYQQCTRPCEPDAGKPNAACKTCSADYKGCMKRCFQ
ncbi:MAG TPA: hypothetical protein VHV51_11570 [Polyangiaceae bacterium]|jgi:hypothetical protein|nr:hypothetical protein [Polyangiaceae bacterium]